MLSHQYSNIILASFIRMHYTSFNHLFNCRQVLFSGHKSGRFFAKKTTWNHEPFLLLELTFAQNNKFPFFCVNKNDRINVSIVSL